MNSAQNPESAVGVGDADVFGLQRNNAAYVGQINYPD
jgi:hypothetical protein